MPDAGQKLRAALLVTGRSGQSLIVWGFSEGRGTARECDRWLMGTTDLR